MLENVKDQIHSLRWLKSEVAPAVPNQTMKNRRLLQLPVPAAGRAAHPASLPAVGTGSVLTSHHALKPVLVVTLCDSLFQE